MDPIKEYFDSEEPRDAPEACPPESDLAGVASGDASPQDRENLLGHLMSCDACTQKLSMLKRFFVTPPAERVRPEGLDRKVLKVLRVGHDASGFQASIWVWFAGFVLFMGLSFIWQRHFVQMLVIALVLAGKWLIESRARILRVDVMHRSSEEARRRRSGRSGLGRDSAEWSGNLSGDSD